MGTQSKSKTLRVNAKAVEVEGERRIIFVASSNREDRDYESVDVKSLRLPLKGSGYITAEQLSGEENVDIPFLLNHSYDVDDVIGSVRKAYLNEASELVFEVGIASRAKAQDMLSLLEEEHLSNAFSITMLDYDYNFDSGVISNAEIAEVSLVFRGSNKEARLLAVKSILKGEHMSKDKQPEEDLASKQARLEALKKEVEEAENAEDNNQKEEQPQEAAAPVEGEAKAEAPAEEQKPAEEAEAEEAPAEAEKQLKKEKKEKTTMSDIDEAAKSNVVVKAAPKQAPKSSELTKADKREVRKAIVEHLEGVYRKDATIVKSAMAKFAKLAEAKGKVIDGTSGAPLFVEEVFSTDILQEYTNVGNVGTLVDRQDILGAETYRFLVEAAGNGFQPVALGGVKPQDQPVWTPVVFEPFEWAIIVPWLDGVAKRTPIAVYNEIVRYIGREYAKLEDRIILSYEGGTIDGETRPATGLIPVLTAASRVVPVTSYDSGDVVPALGEAYGAIESDRTITLVANRQTWGKLAVSMDANDHPIFTTVGQQVVAGALGNFNLQLSQEAPEGAVVVGDYSDYLLVTRGGLEQLFSKEATLGEGENLLNLFTQNASALRSSQDITGGPRRVNSFVVLQFPTESPSES